MPSVEIAGKRVLVLGGSGVLGSLIAGRLVDRGARVLLAGRDRQRLTRAAASIGPDVPFLLWDLGQDDPREMIDTTITNLGGIDGLVVAAGVVAFGPLAEVTDQVLDELTRTDFIEPLRVIRSAIPHLQGGFVVSITGVVAETPYPGLVAYSAVKAGLSAATRALSSELRKDRIHVLDARPPHTETGLAGRPIAGVAPNMPSGLDAARVAEIIVEGLAAGRRELPAELFSG